MNISKIKLALKYVFGGIDSVVEYLLDIVNQSLGRIDPQNRAKIAAAFNTTQKVLSTLSAFQWLCPTKWQSAYSVTIQSVKAVVDALEDMEITADDLSRIKDAFNAAVIAWRGGDVPDTDVDFETLKCTGVED